MPALKPLAGLHMFYSLHKWKMADRTWVDYPAEVMNALTTLEETKPSTCIILVKQYCVELQKTHKDKAKLLQRWKNQEMWTIDKDSLNAFVEELKGGAGAAAPPPAEVDLGAEGGAVNESPTCQIDFKTAIPPFSYVTLMTEKDKELFSKGEPLNWEFKLTTDKSMKSKEDAEIPVWLGIR